MGDEGQRVPNHTVKLLGPIDRLPGVVVVGNTNGKETLIEFYDLNCPYCRKAAIDLGDMLSRDPQLRLVLVPYPVLGVASIGAARVELAVAKLGTPQQFYDFHRDVYSQRGKIDGSRALEIARGLGFDQAGLIALGDSDQGKSRKFTGSGRQAPRLSWATLRSSVIPGGARLRRSSRPPEAVARLFADAPAGNRPSRRRCASRTRCARLA